jgi:hypothetical protein
VFKIWIDRLRVVHYGDEVDVSGNAEIEDVKDWVAVSEEIGCRYQDEEFAAQLFFVSIPERWGSTYDRLWIVINFVYNFPKRRHQAVDRHCYSCMMKTVAGSF